MGLWKGMRSAALKLRHTLPHCSLAAAPLLPLAAPAEKSTTKGQLGKPLSTKQHVAQVNGHEGLDLVLQSPSCGQ